MTNCRWVHEAEPHSNDQQDDSAVNKQIMYLEGKMDLMSWISAGNLSRKQILKWWTESLQQWKTRCWFVWWCLFTFDLLTKRGKITKCHCIYHILLYRFRATQTTRKNWVPTSLWPTFATTVVQLLNWYLCSQLSHAFLSYFGLILINQSWVNQNV